jgi:uncharacterized repeat protein (TIGR01451 family)
LKAVAEMEVEVINDDGQKEVKRVPAAKVVPGDVVIYTIYYTNNGAEAAENFVITNPVPEHMVYLASSAEGDNSEITFSVDGGNSYDVPGNLNIADPEGKPKAAKVSDYTHIRWAMIKPVAPEKTGHVNFKAQLE